MLFGLLEVRKLCYGVLILLCLLWVCECVNSFFFCFQKVFFLIWGEKGKKLCGGRECFCSMMNELFFCVIGFVVCDMMMSFKIRKTNLSNKNFYSMFIFQFIMFTLSNS